MRYDTADCDDLLAYLWRRVLMDVQAEEASRRLRACDAGAGPTSSIRFVRRLNWPYHPRTRRASCLLAHMAAFPSTNLHYRTRSDSLITTTISPTASSTNTRCVALACTFLCLTPAEMFEAQERWNGGQRDKLGQGLIREPHNQGRTTRNLTRSWVGTRSLMFSNDEWAFDS